MFGEILCLSFLWRAACKTRQDDDNFSRLSEELQIFVENSLSSASIAVTLNEESGTL